MSDPEQNKQEIQDRLSGPDAQAEAVELVGEILEALPERQRGEIISRSFQGPLPPPEWFKQYDETAPGTAVRLVDMTAKEQEHRHSWERKALNRSFTDSLVGQVFGLIVALALIGGGVYCATINQPNVAIAFVGAGALGIVGNFIQGRRGKKKE